MGERQQKFTIAEGLMLTAIVGMLVSIAVPAWQASKARGQVSETIAMASAAKATVTRVYQESGEFPDHATPAELGEPLNLHSAYVSHVDVETNGVIEISFGRSATWAIDGQVLSLVPDSDDGVDVRWTCKSTDIPKRYLPVTCRT